MRPPAHARVRFCLLLLVAASPAACAASHARPPSPRLSPYPDLPLAARAPETASFVRTELATLIAVWGPYDLHHDHAADLAFSVDGRTLVSASARGGLRVWDVATRSLRTAISSPSGLQPIQDTVLALSSDGRYAATGVTVRCCDGNWDRPVGTVDLWDLVAQRHLRRIDAHVAPVRALAFARDGALVTFAYEYLTHAHDPWPAAPPPPDLVVRPPIEHDGVVRRWSLATGASISEVHLGAADVAALDTTGGRERLAGYEQRTGTLRTWDLGHPAAPVWQRSFPADPFTGDGAVTALAFTAADELTVARRDDARRLDARDGRDVGRAPPPPPGLGRLRASPTQPLVAAIGSDGHIALLDAATLEEIARHGHAGAVASLSVAARSDLALSVGAIDGGDGAPRFWNVTTGRSAAAWSMHARGGALSPDATRALLTRPQEPTFEGSVGVYDVATARPLWLVPRPADRADAQLSPDGARVLAMTRAAEGSLSSVTMHDARDGARLWSVEPPHGANGSLLAFTPDGAFAITPDADGRLILRDAATGLRARPLELDARARHFAISADGSRAAAAVPPRLVVVDVATGRAVRSLDRDTGGPIALTPDGRTIVTGHYDGTILFRSVVDGSDLGVVDLASSEDRATALGLVDEGRELLVGTRRGAILRFRLHPMPER